MRLFVFHLMKLVSVSFYGRSRYCTVYNTYNQVPYSTVPLIRVADTLQYSYSYEYHFNQYIHHLLAPALVRVPVPCSTGCYEAGIPKNGLELAYVRCD